MNDSKDDSIAIIKRAAMRRQRETAAADAAELKAATWQSRLGRGLRNALICFVVVFAFFLSKNRSNFYPHDLEAFEYLAIASFAIIAVFTAAAIAEEWIEAQTRWGGLWRASARVVFLAGCIGLAVAAYRTADIWVLHFQQ